MSANSERESKGEREVQAEMERQSYGEREEERQERAFGVAVCVVFNWARGIFAEDTAAGVNCTRV